MAEENKVGNDQLRIEFQRYDKNGDGYISKDELKEVLGKVQTLTDQDLEDLMKDLDVNKDGRIDYEEFLKVFVKDQGQ